MKTKDLVKQLQELDPEGNCEVFGAGDIHFAQRLPWYYDGKPGILIRDESNTTSNNIKGMRQITEKDGDKIYLYSIALDDLAMDADKLEDYKIEGDESFKSKYKKYFDDFKKFCLERKAEKERLTNTEK